MKLVVLLPTSPCAENLKAHAFKFSPSSHHSSSTNQHSSIKPSSHSLHMITIRVPSTIASCFFIMCLSWFIFMSYNTSNNIIGGSWWLSFHMWSVIRVLGVVFFVGMVVVVVRTTIVTWITVVVMLAIAGKRRRVLAVQGRKITGDVAMHLLKVLVRERSVVAVACATVFSSVAVVWVA